MSVSIVRKETSGNVKNHMEVRLVRIVGPRTRLGHILDPFYTIASTERIDSRPSVEYWRSTVAWPEPRSVSIPRCYDRWDRNPSSRQTNHHPGRTVDRACSVGPQYIHHPQRDGRSS